MSKATAITEKVKTILSAERLSALAMSTGFIKRNNKIKARDFLMHHLRLSLDKEHSLADMAEEFLESADIEVTKQAIHKKYTANAVDFLHHVLEELMNSSMESRSFLTAIPFITGIKTADSSFFKLNDSLAECFPGVRNQKAGLKLQTVMDVLGNTLYRLDIRSARENDQSYKDYLNDIKPNELSINDLGYFCVDSFKALHEKKAFFLSRLLRTTAIYSKISRKKYDLERCLKKTKQNIIEQNILLGAAHFPCRIVAIRLPEEAYQQRLKNLAEKNRKNGRKKANPSILDEWTILVTNLPDEVTPHTLLNLYGLRWQIELFFKLIKTFFNLRNTSVQQNPHKTLISIYSSLIAAVLLSQCALLIDNVEISLYKAAKIFAKHISRFVAAILSGNDPFSWIVSKILRCARKESTPKRPSAKQALGIAYA